MPNPTALPDSFSTDPAVTGTAERGQLAHRDHIEHGHRFETNLESVAEGVWCLVGNGLSNQTFVEGPDGLIVIDTGECVEEMRAALAAVRQQCSAPIAAVIYTHFHYVAGTAALADESLSVGAIDQLPIWGHERIVANRARTAAELGPTYGRGVVHQFGLLLPADGADGLVNVGLGTSFRNPDHAPYTPGFIPPTESIAEATSTTIAGLRVELTPAPSDADDSITIWFPELGVCVNNLVWPTLFNVFPIRGEEYRDPRVLLDGLDHLISLGPEHLVGAHGPALSGRSRVAEEVEKYRDSIQFMWDQTVRGLNLGLTSDEITEFVQLPDCYGGTYLTRQFYGVVEHHVRQIDNGLRGWFDGDEAKLFPLPVDERARRLIDGFGGRAEVRRRAEEAIEQGDLRWAVELASWLVRSEPHDDGRADGGNPEERSLLASALRAIGQRTTSANIRNWCLTRALELEDTLDLTRFRVHRFATGDVLGGDPTAFVHALRVLLDPAAANGLDDQIAFRFGHGPTAGLHVRNCVAVPTDGQAAPLTIEADHATFARILGRRQTLAEAVESGAVATSGDPSRLQRILACFDLATLQLPS